MHNKLTILFPTLLLITLISCSMQENEKGWTKLFDGKTTAGWHKYGGGAVGSAWKSKMVSYIWILWLKQIGRSRKVVT